MRVLKQLGFSAAVLPAFLALALCCISGCGGCSKDKGGPDGQTALDQKNKPSRADDAEYMAELKTMGEQRNKLAAKVEAIKQKLAKLKADASASPDAIKKLEDELAAAKAACKDDLKAARDKIRARINQDLKEHKK